MGGGRDTQGGRSLTGPGTHPGARPRPSSARAAEPAGARTGTLQDLGKGEAAAEVSGRRVRAWGGGTGLLVLHCRGLRPAALGREQRALGGPPRPGLFTGNLGNGRGKARPRARGAAPSGRPGGPIAGFPVPGLRASPGETLRCRAQRLPAGPGLARTVLTPLSLPQNSGVEQKTGSCCFPSGF